MNHPTKSFEILPGNTMLKIFVVTAVPPTVTSSKTFAIYMNTNRCVVTALVLQPLLELA